jgi:small subunit ribosomal protein S6
LKMYEGLFIFPDSMKEDAVQAAAGRLRSEIEKLGGVVHEVIPLGRRQLARTLKKMECGFFVRIAFDLDPSKVAALRARFKLNESLFREQVVQVDKRAPALDEPAAQPEPAKEGAADGHA